jgi:hypothetical protein
LGNFVLIVWIREKSSKNGKFWLSLQPTKWNNNKNNKFKNKKHWYRGICVCTLNKVWENKLWN